jgi:TPR repeat protein
LAEATTTLAVTRAVAPATPPAAAAAPPNSTTRALSAPQLAPADRDRALKLHARGEEQLGRGNIYAARQFFERAAEAGLAESALAVAATYDAAELARLKVLGLKPDPAEAKKWYEKARELGAPEAEARLRRLGGR